MLTEDYKSTLLHAAAAAPSSDQGQQQQQDQERREREAAIECFCSHVLPHHPDLIIQRSRLTQLLSAEGLSSPAAVDARITLLMQGGALSRHLVDDGCFVLCVPGMGKVVMAVVEARKEIVVVIRKRQYKEVGDNCTCASEWRTCDPSHASCRFRSSSY